MKFFGYFEENGKVCLKKWDTKNFVQNMYQCLGYTPISDEDFERSLSDLELLYPNFVPTKLIKD